MSIVTREYWDISLGNGASIIEEWNAYHEAGHAFVAFRIGAKVRHMTIDPDWDDGPARYADVEIAWPMRKFTEKTLHESLVKVALAGPVAEMIYREDPLHPGIVAEWAHDWKQAWQAAEILIPVERLRVAYLEEATAILYRQLHRDENWAAIAALADELLAHETLEQEEIEHIIRNHLE